MLAAAALFLASLAQSPINTPYAESNRLSLNVTQATPTVPRFGMEEIVLAAHGTYQNPFDPDDVRLDATVTSPSGRNITVPGFFCQNFTRTLVGQSEQVTAKGPSDWRLRICPDELGQYQVNIAFHDRTGEVHHVFSFTSTKSDSAGFVKVSKRDPHYFETDNGAGFFPIGANVCWGNDRGTFNYDNWLPDYAHNGCNYFRVWLSPHWVTFAMEKSGKASEGAGIGQYDLGDLWKLDYVMSLAGRLGMRAMFCIDSYNILRKTDAYPEWDKSPQNMDNGGPLRIWTDFWTNQTMAKLYRNKLRYLVARYGAMTNLFAWEFWNEVDLVQDYRKDDVQAWHEKMGAYLKSIDPYHHLVATSFSDSLGLRAIDLLPQLDFTMTHLYSPMMVGGVAYEITRKVDWGKPTFVGEVGADSSGPRINDDPDGIQIHDPQWAAVTNGSAAGSMPWWWDGLIEPKRLYPLFNVFSKYVSGIDFPGEDFRSVDAKMTPQDLSTPLPNGDLVLDSGPESWQASPANQPSVISVNNGKLDGNAPSGLLHGTRNHPTLHNPLTININETSTSTFQVEVNEVSTYGGAELVVKLDGSPAIDKHFDTGDNNAIPANAHEFDGNYPVTVPPGSHKITVENIGADWIRLAYRFVGIVPQASPAKVWAIVGNHTCLAWIQQLGHNWREVAVKHRTFNPVPATVVTIPGLARGAWKAQVWDTWTGVIKSETTINVDLGGDAKIDVPSFTGDVALKLVKAPS